jgi:hypothetical protein
MVISNRRQQNDRAGRVDGSDGSHIFETPSGEPKVRQDDVRLYVHELLDGSIPVRRLGDLQFQLADDIAQQASQVGVGLDHQHQFALVVVLDEHGVLSFV